MMKNRQNYACAARKQDGSIALDVQQYVSLPEKYPVLALPLIRGVFSFVDSMVLGMPAKVVKELTPAQVMGNRMNALEYVRLAKDFKKD